MSPSEGEAPASALGCAFEGFGLTIVARSAAVLSSDYCTGLPTPAVCHGPLRVYHRAQYRPQTLSARPATEEPGHPTASTSQGHFTNRPPYAATPGKITGAAFPEFLGGQTQRSYKSCRNVSVVSPGPTRDEPAIHHLHHGARGKLPSPAAEPAEERRR
ncbi:hypothetical protein NDU88_003173 [Pleurodeles waltl]|uniref:Uncharacterized protein n=1 Tax=Pleurodeles waltl TaxID=8319 RepID=A0AAV7LKT2_PLEWA|nr:hypothetical protein NDU88_003173 [Pleurodeles waltl]